MGRSQYTLLVEPIDDVKSYYENYSPKRGDSGVDLCMPRDVVVKAHSLSTKIPLGVKVSMQKVYGSHWMASDPVACALLPRSSTGLNTPIRLSNSVGVIDAGYRGELAAVVDNLSSEDFTLEAGGRYFQLCLGDLTPVSSVKVGPLDGETERGTGGFGSTNA